MKWAPTSVRQLIAAEMKLLSHTITRSKFRSSHIALSSGEYINTLEAFHPSADHPPHRALVLAHGFGAGLGLWGPGIDSLVQQRPSRRVVAFDWLGMGGSSRPEFGKRKGCGPQEVVDESLTFFCDSMLEWADRVGLDKFDLVGHSLGGYLSANFAMRHPDRVANLVLVSPVGLPSHPAAQNMALESSSEPTVSTDDPANDAAKANSAGIPPEVWKTLPWQLRMIVRAWNFNVTPQGIVRMLGKYGPKVMSAAVGRRLGHAISDSDSAELVSSYLYHVTASAGSGEFAMNALLSPQVVNGRPGVYARRPIGEDLKRLPMPVTVMFGDNDWMAHPDAPNILQAVEGPGLVTIPSAGHHLYLDNPTEFQSVLKRVTAT